MLNCVVSNYIIPMQKFSTLIASNFSKCVYVRVPIVEVWSSFSTLFQLLLLHWLLMFLLCFRLAGIVVCFFVYQVMIFNCIDLNQLIILLILTFGFLYLPSLTFLFGFFVLCRSNVLSSIFVLFFINVTRFVLLRKELFPMFCPRLSRWLHVFSGKKTSNTALLIILKVSVCHVPTQGWPRTGAAENLSIFVLKVCRYVL